MMFCILSPPFNRVVSGNVFMLALASFFKWRLSWQDSLPVACVPEHSATV